MAAHSRTDIANAMQQVLKALADGRPYTLTGLVKEANLNFSAVKKAVEFVEQTQRSLHSRWIRVFATSDNHTMVQAKKRSGLISLSELQEI